MIPETFSYWYAIRGQGWSDMGRVTIFATGDLRRLLEAKYGLTFVADVPVNGCSWAFTDAYGGHVAVTVEDDERGDRDEHAQSECSGSLCG